ncbi:hypothetical protein BGY98DRAFT_1043526, partial [Russula aff. rugulosa BPL654]
MQKIFNSFHKTPFAAVFERSNLLETTLQVLQGWEKGFDESPITIAIFFEKDYRDGNWRLINCLSLEVNSPPWILRYPCEAASLVTRIMILVDTRTGVGRPCRMVGASVSHIIDLTGLRRFSHRCKTLRANCKYHLIQPSQPPLTLLFLPPLTFGPRQSRI